MYVSSTRSGADDETSNLLSMVAWRRWSRSGAPAARRAARTMIPKNVRCVAVRDETRRHSLGARSVRTGCGVAGLRLAHWLLRGRRARPAGPCR